MSTLIKKPKSTHTPIKEVTISLLSPQKILQESFGEITRPETKNHRTYKSVEQGLFCERIFGPDEDWKCLCGKYKGIRHKKTQCDACGVEINERRVRRDRIGHIQLAVPVVHVWFFKYLPNKISLLLGIPSKELDEIIKYSAYVIIQKGTVDLEIRGKELEEMSIITIKEYNTIIESLSINNQKLDDENPNKFIAKTGGEAIETLLKNLNLEKLSSSVRTQINKTKSKQRKTDLIKRLQIVEAFRSNQNKVENRPEWMTIRVLPVISPELRPLMLLNNRFTMSDLTDLYKRIVNRNLRVRKLIEMQAPKILVRNECRLLQESVDALFDNSSKGSTVVTESGRPLKSLSDNLKGKQGRFRQNLLGKRTDYSGRSVIVSGPELKLHECGLPKEMAVELFKPFIIKGLIDRGKADTVKDAKSLIDTRDTSIWDILQNQVKDHPILLNRAPTLHRLSIQAFIPKIIEGKAIQLHPLTCPGFNADFDGDQMAVYVPLSEGAIAEAFNLMLSTKNLLNPINGQPIVSLSKDMVLGLYYLTKGKKSTTKNPIKGEGMTFYHIEEVIIAVNNGQLSEQAHIKIRINEPNQPHKKQIIETIAGRALFNQYIPKELGYINELLTKQTIQHIVSQAFTKTTQERTAKLLDDLKDLGFKYCYQAGLSISLSDIKIPKAKEQLIQKAQQEVASIKENYLMGITTNIERYNQTIDIWTKVNIELTQKLIKELEQDKEGFNNIFMMMDSGARGSREQVRQLAGMRGLMVKPQKNATDPTGGIIEIPILNNLKEGLIVSDYFNSVHGARKGLTDTSMKTADAGYSGRKFTNVAQSLSIQQYNCGTQKGLIMSAIYDNEGIVKSLTEQVEGRVPVQTIKNPITGEPIVKANQTITKQQVIQIEKANIKNIKIRAVTTCESKHGICVLCYGIDLSNQKIVQEGTAIGLIAAQSLAEPAAQLTLRTFHLGGSSLSTTVEDRIKTSLSGMVHFENLKKAPIEKNHNKVHVVLSRTSELQILDPTTKQELTSYHIPYGAHLTVEEGEKVEKKQEVCYWDSYNAVILAEADGQIAFNNIEEDITYKKEYDEQTGYYDKVIIESKDKTKNPSISLITKEKTFTYNVPVNALLIAKEEAKQVKAGEILAKIPRIVRKMQDITGGLPRVTELFEARNPSNAAVLSPIEGIVSYGKVKRGSREVTITAKDGTQAKALIPLSKHVLVQDQEYVKSSTMLSDGVISIVDILEIEGAETVQKYIIEEIQTVYRTQGVKINNKHIEVIVRQMMQKVEIFSSGDTIFMPEQLVSKNHFQEENQAIKNQYIIIEIEEETLPERKKQKANVTCSICLEKVKDDACQTPCNHDFHKKCIKKWLNTSQYTCPNCRSALSLQDIEKGHKGKFSVGGLITESELTKENEKRKHNQLKPILTRKARPAVAKLKIQGITQTVTHSESFLAAAAFQETTKVLSAAAIAGKVDHLRGIKENVIVGNLIPVGTGLTKYKKMVVTHQEEYNNLLKAQKFNK